MIKEPIRFSCKAMEGVHEKVLELSKPLIENSHILVMGSGEGSFEYKLISMGVPTDKITSVDIDPKQFRLEEMKCGFCDLDQKLPFKKDSFDICVAIEVIEHLFNPQNLINEAYRILNCNGILFLTTPNVHSITQKIRYLLTDNFRGFLDKNYLGSGHIHPIFHWLLLRMIKNKFKIESYESNFFRLRILPFLPPIKIPFKHRYFAVINIYMLKTLKSERY